MADRVKGITINIGGDTSGLSKALSGVNREIRDTQSQLKDVERLLKLDPKNTELLEQKQRLLGQAVGDTKNKLTALKEAEKQAQQQFAEGKISQEQYEGLQREIVDTEQKLKSLKKEAEDFGSVFSQQAKAAGEKMQEVGGKISGVGKKIMPVSTVITGVGAVSYKMAAEVEDALGATDQIYGGSSDTVKNWAKSLKSYYGIAEGDALEYSNMMGTMLQNIGGLSEAEAAKQSAMLVELAGDLTAMYGGTTEDAIRALTGALKGNNSMLDNYGMAVTEATVKSKALDMGLIEQGETMDLNAKQAATLALIQEQSAAAQGQAAREADGASGSLRALETEAKNLGASFGEVLLPAITPIIGKITEAVEWFKSLDDNTKNIIVAVLGFVAVLGPLLVGIGNTVSAVGTISTAIGTVSGTVLPKLSSVFSSVFSFIAANPVALLIAAIVGLVALIATKGDQIQAILKKVDNFLQGIFARDWSEVLGPVLGGILNGFFANVKNIWDSIKRIFSGVIDFIRGVFTGDWSRAWNGIKDIFGGIFGGLVALVKAPINAIIGLLNGAIGGINWMIGGLNRIHFSLPSWIPGVGGRSFGINIGQIGSIPYLAKGGMLSDGSAVVGDAGPELLSMVNGRAVVQPLTNSTANTTNAMGGVNIVVNAAPGQSETAIAEIVADKLEHMTRQKGAVWA